MEGIRDFSPSACVLQIRRTNLLQDAISGFLSHSAQDLLKPLRVRMRTLICIICKLYMYLQVHTYMYLCKLHVHWKLWTIGTCELEVMG